MKPKYRPPRSQDATSERNLNKETLLTGIHHRGYLPHFKVDGAMYFVTFRLADSLPKSVLQRFDIERRQLQQKAELKGTLSMEDRKRLDHLYSERIEAYLDAGHGRCSLRRPDIAGVIKEALLHFDGQRYQLDEWVIMPNHVHVLVAPGLGHSLSSILHSWKSFTSNEANKVIASSGEFWQKEGYDHLVRNEEELWRLRAYIRNNPVKAGLCKRAEDWPFGSAAKVVESPGWARLIKGRRR